MRFTLSLTVAAPRDVLWNTFTDRSRLSSWQSTLERAEPVCGVAGEIGAVTKMTYREAGRLVVMLETVTARHEGREFTCHYAAGVSESTIQNEFADGPAGAVWTCRVDLAFKGLLYYLSPLIRPVAIKKTRIDMERLRLLVEREVRAAEAPRS